MAKITIHNGDTAFYIDTYQHFTYDNTEELIISDYNDEHDTDYDYDHFTWSYDNAGYIKALAEASIEAISEVVLGDIVTGIELESTGSPKYYNYSTDYYKASWSYNLDKLLDWIQERIDSFRDHYAESWRNTLPLGITIRDYLDKCYTDDTAIADRYGEHRDNVIRAMLDYYSRSIYNDKAGSFYEMYYYDIAERVDPSEYISYELDTESIETPSV